MRVLNSLYEKMEDELKQICKKEPLTKEDVELVYKMIDILKDITTIDAMNKPENEGWAHDYSGDYSNTYGYRRSYDDGSYRRGRDSMGRYTSRDDSYRGSYEDSYSRHSKEEMINNLKSMMENARTPEERENYRATIEQMSR